MVSGVPYDVPLRRRALPELMDEGVVTLQAGDALKDPALKEHGPFDAIHVGASAGHIPEVSTLTAVEQQAVPPCCCKCCT